MPRKNWTSSVSSGKRKLTSRQAELDQMYRNFEAEQVMLSDELKKKAGG